MSTFRYDRVSSENTGNIESSETGTYFPFSPISSTNTKVFLTLPKFVHGAIVLVIYVALMIIMEWKSRDKIVSKQKIFLPSAPESVNSNGKTTEITDSNVNDGPVLSTNTVKVCPHCEREGHQRRSHFGCGMNANFILWNIARNPE